MACRWGYEFSPGSELGDPNATSLTSGASAGQSGDGAAGAGGAAASSGGAAGGSAAGGSGGMDDASSSAGGAQGSVGSLDAGGGSSAAGGGSANTGAAGSPLDASADADLDAGADGGVDSRTDAGPPPPSPDPRGDAGAETDAGGVCESASCRGPIVHFPLDGDATEVRGLTVGESVGGMLFASGPVGLAGDFRGGTQHVRAGGLSPDDFTPGPLDPPDLTLSFFARRDAATNLTENSEAIAQKGRRCLAHYGCAMEEVDQIRCGINHGGDWCPGYRSIQVAFPSDQWTHVAFTVDRHEPAGFSLRLYLGGVLAGSLDSDETYPHVVEGASSPFVIGRNYQEPDGSGTALHPFEGLVDDVRLYDRAMSPSEVDELVAGD